MTKARGTNNPDDPGTPGKRKSPSPKAMFPVLAPQAKPVDEKTLRTLASLQCSYEEIAAHFGCSATTLTTHYLAVIQEEREKGKAGLRRLQWKRAQRGSDRLLVHLGKNILGQSDHTTVDISDLKNKSDAELQAVIDSRA